MAIIRTRPILHIKPYGLHVIETKPGCWCYTGCIPRCLHGQSYATRREAREMAYRTLFCEYLNDYLTVARWAEDYGVSESHAAGVLSIGRRLMRTALPA